MSLLFKNYACIKGYLLQFLTVHMYTSMHYIIIYMYNPMFSSNTSEAYTVLAKSYFQRILQQSILEHPSQSLWHVMQADYFYGNFKLLYVCVCL